MALIIPILLAAMMLVTVIALGSVTFAMAATASAFQAVGKTQATRSLKLIIIAAACLAFIYGWTALGPVTEDGISALFEFAIKAVIGLLAASAIMVCAAMALKLATRIPTQGSSPTSTRLYGATLTGLALGVCVLIGAETVYRDQTAPAPPIHLSLTGAPTHCVWKDSSLRSHRSRRKATSVVTLSRGQQLRLEPNMRLTTHSGTIRFAITRNGEQQIVYGQSTDFRRIDFNVDAECQW